MVLRRIRAFSLGLVFPFGVGITLLFSLFAAQSVGATAGVNEQLNYQARLLQSTGAVVPDGTYNIEFKIYQDGNGVLGGGDETLKWTETRTGGDKVTVTNGYFSVQLGSVTPFASNVDWNQDTLWLALNVGGTGTPTWDGEMSPFRRLAAATYALNSKQLGGLDWSKFVQIAPAAVQTDTSALPMLFLNKNNASGNILQLQKSGADVFSISNSGLATFSTDADFTLSGTENIAVTSDLAGTVNLLSIIGTPSSSAGTAQGLFIQQASSGNSNGLDAAIVIDNADGDLAVTDGLLITSTGFNNGVVDAIDVSASNIQNGINLGSNNLILAGDTINDFTGNAGLVVTANALGIDAVTTSTTVTTSSNSGLEIGADGLRLLGGCTAGVTDILKWSGTAWDCAADVSGGGGATLQSAYDGDANGSDAIITLSGNDDSIIFRNPASSGTDSGYAVSIEQLNTGAVDGLRISSAGTGYALRIDDVVSDNTPFIVDGDGRVGIGTTSIAGSTERLLQVGSPTNRGNAAVYGDIVSQGVSDITALTGIKDIFLYDTTADSDGGRWIDWATTDRLSWYTETLDDSPSDPCDITTDDRCYITSFPRKAILVVTDNALYIFDAATNDMWMKFSQNAAGWALGADTNNNPTSVTAVNGVVYVGTNGSSQGGLYVFDFVNDRMWNIDGTDRSGADVGISQRNGAVTYASDNNTSFDLSVSGTAAEWEDINDVSATYISGSTTAISIGAAANTSPGSGQTFVALATDSGVTVINMTAQKLLQYSDVTADDYTSVVLTKRGRMYALNTTSDQAEKWLNFDTDKASEINGTFDGRYDETVGPALWSSTPNILTGAPDALEVIERGSLAEDTSDILYVGHSLGLTEIHDHTTNTNGWSKFFDTTRQTMLMPAAIDAALMLDDSSGTLANDASFNNTDMTIVGSPTLGVSGVRGKAIQFDNTNDYLCSDTDQNGTCDTDASFNMSTTGWTLSMWFKHSTTAPASGVDMLFERCVNATPAQAIGCVAAYMTTTGAIVVGNDDDATWTQGSSYDITSTSSLSYNDNQWHQLIISRTNANDVDTYIDGNPLNLSTATGNTITLDGSQITTIGGSCSPTTGANCAAANALNIWDGAIDDVTFSNGATTVAQMSALQARRLYNDARPLVTKRVINVTDATGATSTTITDSGESWIPNEFAGMFVTLTGGTGSGETRRISGNTATALTVTPAFQTTPDTTTDFEIDPEALYGASNSVYGIGVTAENPLGQARQMCVGTNNGSDGGGVTCYNHQAGPNLIADLFHSDSEQTDDFGVEWTGTDYDDIRSVDMSGRALLIGSEAHLYAETSDVRLGQGLDYVSNQLFNIRAELINDGILLTGSQALEVGFTGGADLAERYVSDEALVPGEVVSLKPNSAGTVKKSTSAYQKDILGIVATAPGITIGPQDDNSYPIALVGRVPVKVTTENGVVKSGDRVTSASLAGYGMKATHAGRVLGTALDDFIEDANAPCPEGTPQGVVCGTVTVFVNLVDYNGDSVELAVAQAEASGALQTGSVLGVMQDLVGLDSSLTAEQALAANQKLSKADKILRYLAGRNQDTTSGSEVLTDRVSTVELNTADAFAKSITTFDLKVGNGLAVGGQAKFTGDTFFYKLVTFVEKTVFNNDVSFAAHILTEGEAPAVVAESAAGVGAIAVAEGNDSAGRIAITFGQQDVAAGKAASVQFKKPFAKQPIVLLTPANETASSSKYFVVATKDGFTLTFTAPPSADTSTLFNYWVVE